MPPVSIMSSNIAMKAAFFAACRTRPENGNQPKREEHEKRHQSRCAGSTISPLPQKQKANSLDNCTVLGATDRV